MAQLLVALDGSPASLRALDVAVGLARDLGAELKLVYVAEPDAMVFDPLVQPEVESEVALAEAGAEVLREAGARAARAGVRVRGELRFGPAADRLAEAAAEPQVQQVVMGTRGRGAVARALLGSVSSRVIELCDKPVLVVH